MRQPAQPPDKADGTDAPDAAHAAHTDDAASADDPDGRGEAHARPVAIVVAGGDPIDPAVLSLLPAGGFVIAADSGADHAAALGLGVDLLVGDLDSISSSARTAVERTDADVDIHPTAKDKTDLELALDAAAARGFARIIVIGGYGGRLDHFVANLLLLAAPAFTQLEIEAQFGPRWGRAVVIPAGQERLLTGAPGDFVTLLAIGGTAEGVTTKGLQYPLESGVLQPGSSLGVSNRFVGGTARVAVEEGVVIALQPGGNQV